MKNLNARTAAALLLLAAVVLYRLCIGLQSGHLPWLENFAPVAAIALCGGIYLPRRLAFAIPLGALFISDLFLNAHYNSPLLSSEMISRYLALAGGVLIGLSLRNRASLAAILPASILSSSLFYLVTNTSSWLTSPAYAKTFAGWFQALTIGLPAYPPTWTFFRSSLISDALFSLLFILSMKATHPSESPAAVAGTINCEAGK